MLSLNLTATISAATDLQQLVPRLQRSLPPDRPPREDGANVMVGPHLLSFFDVDSALEGDSQSTVFVGLSQKGHLKWSRSSPFSLSLYRVIKVVGDTVFVEFSIMFASLPGLGR